MIDMYDLIAYIKHTGCRWEILTASNCDQQRVGCLEKKSWIKKYVDPSVVVNCTFTGSRRFAYAMKKNVLIDDRPKNMRTGECGGMRILHTSCTRILSNNSRNLETENNGSNIINKKI